MKLIHIGDVHVGAIPDSDMPWSADRAKEIWGSVENIIDICNKEKADLLLIAGDLFHRQPLLKELKEINYYFGRLKTAQVVIMAGNHDYIGTRSYYQGFEWDSRVHMFIKDTLETFVFPEINTEVYGLSYCKRDITQPLYDDVKPAENDCIHILLAHGGDEKNIPLNKKKLQESGFDYIALGHIHKPEIISPKMAYCGSLEPLDKNETGERGYILADITTKMNAKRQTSLQFVASAARQYKRLFLDVDQDTTNGKLLDMTREVIKHEGSQNIYQFIIRGIRDEGMFFDKEAVKALGNISEVIDESVPDYDFDAIYRENKENIIGMFIHKIRENATEDETARKALYYGIEALLSAKDK